LLSTGEGDTAMAKKVKQPKRLDPSLPIYQLKITLQHIKPLIWRRVETDDCPLDELHDIIQVSMGWDDEHMHVFEIDGEQYACFEDADPYEYRDSRKVRLSDLVEQGCLQFVYEYDFGDSWRHTVEIEKTLPPEPGVRYPRCVAGERGCPPEDCGGPWGYPDFLEAIQDPNEEEHEETLEWVGEEFDPEEFDPSGASEELQHLRWCLGKKKGRHSPKATFSKEEQVRVKSGVAHTKYPDIPLGGWVGEVVRIVWLTPVGYEVRWTKATLDRVHPVYLKRCKRDEIDADTYWLEEENLEAAPDESPPVMDQPASLITRPLSADDSEDRIRMMFGLTSDDPLPVADSQTQQRYLEFLKARLSFPFKADYWPASAGDPKASGEVTVHGFAQEPIDADDGIVCEARKGKRAFPVPLSMIHVGEDGPNFQHVEDYTYWLWEVEEYDEDEEGIGEDDDSDEDEDFEDDDFEEDEDLEDDDFEEEDDLTEDESVEPPQFPIGTMAFYGPDDETTTKIVTGVIPYEGADPILNRWVAANVMNDPKVQREIDRFFEKHGVKSVGMSDGNMGCPHEEGEDFPVGGDCPFCPWWKGKQGSGA
jgi:hypothetical protein